MRNYPNMSYCMAENTLASLSQLMEAMLEEGPRLIREMNRDEKRAYQELFGMCEDFLTLAEDIENNHWTNDNEDEEDEETL